MDHWKAKELSRLHSFVTRLNSLGLISPEELSKFDRQEDSAGFKAEIFELISMKEGTVGTKIYGLVRSWFKKESKKSALFADAVIQPLKINTVVDCIFGFLGLNDLKNCRQVCQKWYFVAEPLIRKRSLIRFNNNERMAKFDETFENCGTNVPFTVFELIGSTDFSVPTVTDFFANHRKNILSLKLNFEGLVDENLREVHHFDIGDWISGSSLTNLVVNCAGRSNNLTVPLYHLESVKKLTLRMCYVKFRDGIQISPEEISFEDLIFYKGEHRLPSVHLNDFMNVKKLKKVEIMQDSDDDGGVISFISSMNLDGCDIEELDLTNVTAINWTASKFNINTLRLRGVDFLGKTKVKIMKLYFTSAIIDLFALPVEINEIVFNGQVSYICTQPIILPNLKFLSFEEFRADDSQVIRHFGSCANLVAVYLCGNNDEDEDNQAYIIIDLDLLPKSIKKLSLEGVQIVTGNENEKLCLDTLVLKQYCLIDTERILEKISTQVLALRWAKNYDSFDGILKFLGKQFCPKQVYMGPFNWYSNEHDSNRKRYLIVRVDKESRYYLFERGRGKSIEESHFDEKSDIFGK